MALDLTIIDPTAPTLVSAAVNGSALVLTYDEALDALNPPAASAFTVNAGGSPIAVDTVGRQRHQDGHLHHSGQPGLMGRGF